MFLKNPLGEKGLPCDGFDTNFCLSPRPLVCQGISSEEATPIRHFRERSVQQGPNGPGRAFLQLKAHSYVLSVGRHSEETVTLVSIREPTLESHL